MGTSTSRPTAALAALTENEKASVLDGLLAIRPDLQQLAEAHAARLLSDEDRYEVADAVEYALLGTNIEDLAGHAGYQPGQGYVHPIDAAAEILDDELEPFLRGLERRTALAHPSSSLSEF